MRFYWLIVLPCAQRAQAADTTPPTAPSNLTASAPVGPQVSLSWTASTDDVGVTGYLVERCTGVACSSFAQIGTSTAAAYSDTTVSGSSAYSYRVRATDAAGNLSPYSGTATVDLSTTQTASETYTYDAAGRLSGVTNVNDTVTSYTLDAAGNRIQVAVAADTGTPGTPTGLTGSAPAPARPRRCRRR